jgi:hypothetical protein
MKGNIMIQAPNEAQIKVYKALQNIQVIQRLFIAPEETIKISDVTFKLVQKPQTDFDYDSDDGKETQAVYQAVTSSGSVYILIYGVYYSYDGLKPVSWFFAKPKEVKTTQFVKI